MCCTEGKPASRLIEAGFSTLIIRAVRKLEKEAFFKVNTGAISSHTTRYSNGNPLEENFTRYAAKLK